jgi:biopolymer transport protein ExbD
MRRFSQRSHLVTLSEINITPLLDLAFVLLIIFVITTPLLEKGIELNLPRVGGEPDKPIRKEDIRTVEIGPQGQYFLDRRAVTIAGLEQLLKQDYRSNPNLVVYIRGDRKSPLEYSAAVMDCCQRNGITRFSLRTDPQERR